MRKISIMLIALLFLIKLPLKADEGMWLLTLLNKNYNDMKKQGFKLTPEDIYSINNASLKDAVVIFGGFCTGEIVSEKGLLFTNHHCGYGQIQSHSSLEHNYLRDGFAAPTLKEELPNPGLFVSFLVRLEDVTEKMKTAVGKETDEAKIADILKATAENIRKEATENTHYRAEVKPYFNNNQYFVLVYENYTDVRLVATPPESIGKFGHDTDNWMYPRHTGDFSVFRVYSGPDGKPAPYSEENIPLKPKKILEVSVAGVKEGDFAMIMGYPGSTDRYLTSWGVEELLTVEHPNRIKIRGIRQDIIMEDMKADEKIKIQYSSKFARSSNYWKYSIGQKKGLEDLNVLAKKQAIEKEFTEWVNDNKKRKAEYGETLNLMKTAYTGRKEFQHAAQYLRETQLQGMELIGLAQGINAYLSAGRDATPYVEGFFKNYNKPTDIKASKAMLKLYKEDIKPEFYPAFFANVEKEYAYDFDKFVDNLFATSILADEAKCKQIVAEKNFDLIKQDVVFKMMQDITGLSNTLSESMKMHNENLAKARQQWMKGLMEMQPNKNFSPDANFTMRLTYGNVLGYKGADAVSYHFETTLKGVMEKEIPGDFEFDVDPRLKKIYETKDYGQYGNADGSMSVCFLSNNDITGGNSGSPILNGKGQLIGLAFDGNWEAMSGDIAFEPDLQRTINVDVRYVLLILDKVLGAKHLVDELVLAK